MVVCQSSHLNQNKPFSGPVSTLMSSAEFYSFSLPSRLRAVGLNALTYDYNSLECFSNECRKTKTKVITLANHNKHKLPNEPIRT